eukprot:3899256-Rhodomonas_salina.3
MMRSGTYFGCARTAAGSRHCKPHSKVMQSIGLSGTKRLDMADSALQSWAPSTELRTQRGIAVDALDRRDSESETKSTCTPPAGPLSPWSNS